MEKIKEHLKTEHKIVCAKNQLRSLYLDGYPCFGWELSKTKGKSVLHFKRNANAADSNVRKLQKEFDEAVLVIKKCQTLQRLCSDAALVCAVVLAILYFIFVELKVTQSDFKIILHAVMGVCLVLPFVLRGFTRKGCIAVTKSIVDQRLSQIRDICKKAKALDDAPQKSSIYILLTKPSTYISRVINFKTKDKYTHASVAFSDKLQVVYSFSRKWVWMPLPAGFRLEHLEKSFKNKNDEVMCALYELKVEKSVYDMAKQRAEQMIVEAPIYKFNLLGLFLCGFGIPLKRKKCYFCSEFVGEILSFSNALILPKEPALMRPNDYTDIPGLSCIFEGKLSALSKQCS